MSDRTLTLKLVSDVSKVSKDVKTLTGQVQSFGTTVKRMGAGLGIAFGIEAAVNLMGDAITAASDLAEQQSKVGVVFGDSADEVQAWARDLSSAYGLSERAALSFAGQIGSVIEGMGLSADRAADMSQELGELAGDLASFNNADIASVIAALQSGLVGESEPLRRFGVNLSAAAVDAYALSHGLAATKSAMTDSARVQARYELIMKATAKAQGDATRTADTYAGAQRRMGVVVEEASAAFGKLLIDSLGPVLEAFVALADQAPDTSTAVGRATAAMRESIKETAGESQDLLGTILGVPDAIGRALYGVLAPQDQAIHEYVNAHAELVDQLGVTRRELGLFIEAMLGAGRSWEQVDAAFRDLKFAVYLEAWDAAWKRVPDAPAEAVGKTREEVDRMRHVVAALTFHVRSQEGAYDEAWERLTAWATDNMRTSAEEVRRLARRATRNAAEAAAEGQYRVAQRWRRIAAAMKSPIVQAMIEAGVAVDEAIADFWRAREIFRRVKFDFGFLGGSSSNWGPPKSAGGGSSSGPSTLSATASGAYGATSAGFGFGLAAARGLAAAGGRSYTVNVNAAASDPYRVGQSVVAAIKAFESRDGRSWRNG